MKAIGGYFELELSKGNQVYHKTYSLKSGRAALHFILDSVKAKKIHIPFYTCNALLEPILQLDIPFEYYALNEALEPIYLPDVKKDEYFLFINYFDLKRNVVKSLSLKYGAQLIIDGSQSFFLKPDGKSWYFNSCRKFFGVPDGAYIYAPDSIDIQLDFERNQNFTVQHLIHRKLGETKKGYPLFLQNEELCGAELKQMSELSEELLSLVPYDLCMQKRNENFKLLHQALKHKNLFHFTDAGKGVPMAYPFLPEKKIKHEKLWNKGFFIPMLWKDVLNRKETNYAVEKDFSQNLLALPVDHRYGTADMYLLIDQLQSL